MNAHHWGKIKNFVKLLYDALYDSPILTEQRKKETNDESLGMQDISSMISKGYLNMAFISCSQII